MTRHAVPATLTTAGRVVPEFVPGPAEALTGWRRWREVYARFRCAHPAVVAARLTVGAWRHGVVLSGAAS